MTVTTVAAGSWTVAAQTRARFAARNFGFRTVFGSMAVTTGQVQVGPAGQPTRLYGALDPATIDTGHTRRDLDLRGKRFLDVERHPMLEVLADRFEQTPTGWRADAMLRMKDHEVPLSLDGQVADDSTAARMIIAGTARLDLRSVGIRVPGFLVGRWVDLAISACLTRSN